MTYNVWFYHLYSIIVFKQYWYGYWYAYKSFFPPYFFNPVGFISLTCWCDHCCKSCVGASPVLLDTHMCPSYTTEAHSGNNHNCSPAVNQTVQYCLYLFTQTYLQNEKQIEVELRDNAKAGRPWYHVGQLPHINLLHTSACCSTSHHLKWREHLEVAFVNGFPEIISGKFKNMYYCYLILYNSVLRTFNTSTLV